MNVVRMAVEVNSLISHFRKRNLAILEALVVMGCVEKAIKKRLDKNELNEVDKLEKIFDNRAYIASDGNIRV